MKTPRIAHLMVERQFPLTGAFAAVVCLAMASSLAHATELDAPTRQLFAWFDELEVFPKERTLICTVYRPDPQFSLSDPRPQIGIVASQRKDWLSCWTLTLFQQQRRLADRRPDASIDDFDISQLPKHVRGNTPFREVTVAEACGVFLNYYREPQPPFERQIVNVSSANLRCFVMAWLAFSDGQPQLAEEILSLTIPRGGASQLTKPRLSEVFARQLHDQIMRDWCFTETSLSAIHARMQHLHRTLPDTTISKRIGKTAGRFTAMLKVEAEHVRWKTTLPPDRAAWPQAASIRDLIYQLRDANGQPMFNGHYGHPFATGDESAAGPQLVKVGLAAVPELLESLDDESFSRSITQCYEDPMIRVMTVGEVSVFALSDIARRDWSQKLRGSVTFQPDPAMAEIRREINDWWQSVGRLGEVEVLRKRLAHVKEGFEIHDIAKRLKQLDPDGAIDVIERAMGTQPGYVQASIVECLAEIPSSEATAFLERMRSSQHPSVHVMAVRQLKQRGAGDYTADLLVRWKSITQTTESIRQSRRSDADPNAFLTLFHYLLEFGGDDFFQTLPAVIQKARPQTAGMIVQALDLTFGRDETEYRARREARPDHIRNRALVTLLTALEDERRPPSVFQFPNGTVTQPTECRVCDSAAIALASLMRWKFEWPSPEDSAAWNRVIEDVKAELERRQSAGLLLRPAVAP